MDFIDGLEPPDDDLETLMREEAEIQLLKHEEKSNTTFAIPTIADLDNVIDEYLATGAGDGSSEMPEPKRARLSSADSFVVDQQPEPRPLSYRIPQIGERKIYRRRPTESDYQAVTSSDGSRFYLRFKPDEDEEALPPAPSKVSSGLCTVPYGVLYVQALTERVGPEAVEETIADNGAKSAVLWVEKFKPKNFVQLLSDDGTNRSLLRWLKLWDESVFGKMRRTTKEGEEELVDKSGRPLKKVTLLHGPPGLGKTTLAHVIASTAGYKVVEMNASDDRSLEKFREKLESSTQMKSVILKDGRPNCLVIDEIDGAPAHTINFLVSTLANTESGSKGGKKKLVVQRPIICICNDLYVPALKSLRQQALVIPFPPTLSSRLVQRLQEVASKECMRVDQAALLALAEKSSNDIRSCLSTMQFFKSRERLLKADDVRQMSIGMKDTQKSHFTVWKEIFGRPSPDVLKTVYSCGDYERLMQGLFENYLDVKFKDAMGNIIKGNEWLRFFDILQQNINRSQNYSTFAYLPFAFVASHSFFSTSIRHTIKYPKTHFEKRNATRKSVQLVEALVSELSPATRAFSSSNALVMDLLPILLEIVQPNLRAVNTQLYSAKEKAELANLVTVLLDYNLTFVQEKTADGQYIYRLDPGIEDVVHFPDMKHKALSYALKQMISHQVQVEKMRRNEPMQQPEKVLPNHWKQKLEAKSVKERIPVDFFGRPIVVVDKKAKECETEPTQSKDLLSGDIWFKFKEGYSNAVRRDVKLKDLA